MEKILLSFFTLFILISCDKELKPEYFNFGIHYGGENLEYGRSVSVTQDGGYIICGTTGSYGSGENDVFLIKTDSSGGELWSNTFGGEDDDWGNIVTITQDGGYIICGSTESFGSGERDMYVIKTDSNAEELWSKTFGGENIDSGTSIYPTNDGGYIICGGINRSSSIDGDINLLKIDRNGEELWNNTFGEEGWDYARLVLVTQGGGYIICGTKNYLKNSEVYLIKTDNNGNEQWSKSFGGDKADNGESIVVNAAGEYIICGSTASFGSGNTDVYLIKTDSNGKELWSKTFGGENWDYGNSISITQDGDYIICGSTESFGSGERDVYLIKTDSNGEELWSKTFGGEEDDNGDWITVTPDGDYIVCGTSSPSKSDDSKSDIFLIKTDSKGNLLFMP